MRKIVELIVGPMNFLGFNPLRRDTFLDSYVRMFLTWVVIAYGFTGCILFTYHANNDFYNFALPVAFQVSYLSVIIVTLAVLKYRLRIRDVLSRIDKNVFRYPDEDNFRPKYKTYLTEENHYRIRMLVLFIQITGYAVAALSPFVAYFLVGRLNTYLYPQWTLWSVDTTSAYLLTYFLQVIVAIGCFWLYFMVNSYFTLVLVEFLRQYTKLQYAIETLNQRSYDQVLAANFGKPLASMTDRRREFDRVFQTNLIMCIRHHQKLIELFKTFKILFEIGYSADVFAVTFGSSLLLYCLIDETDAEHFVSLIGAAWELFGIVFFKCIIGEEFSEMNWRIQFALFYETQWYDQSLKNRKLISIFHLSTRNPLTLKSFRIFESSYYVFSGIVRTSYSYFNLIRASY